MIITKEFFRSGMSDRGGYSGEQLVALGIRPCGEEPGWKNRLIGKEISDEKAKLFIDLKNTHLIKREQLREKKNKGILEKEKLDNQTNAFTKTIPVIGDIAWKDQYSHPNWQKRRLRIMQRDGFKCMVCGEKHKMLHVHHNSYDAKYIWDCQPQSMITLCIDCHEIFHRRTLKG